MLFIGCPILIAGPEFIVDLHYFDLINFNVLLGMDWLPKHDAQIDFLKLKGTLKGPTGDKVVYEGAIMQLGVNIIFTLNAHKLLN